MKENVFPKNTRSLENRKALETMEMTNKQIVRAISALWDAVEQIRQALPRCTGCDSLLHKGKVCSDRCWCSEYCSWECHQVENHT